MTLFETIDEYILSKSFVVLDFPFDETTRVYKIGGKMFALIGETKDSINLKNTPEKNLELRTIFPEVVPGYHMNKTHWNTVMLSEELIGHIFDWIDESYSIVFKSLTRKQKLDLVE
ncbi:MAG: MmcQ/YjbR family DNA-binding protein [Culicoidibacterales bacterium]